MASSNGRLRVGIVGAGSMGHAHAAGWAAAGAELVGVMAKHPASAQALAARYGARVYDSYAELLEQVEVADLCVPTDLHHEMTLAAAAAGRHVVCEKPIALSVEDGQEMIDACNRAGVRLFVAMVVRFFPQYRAAAELVRGGRLGELGVLRLRRVSYPPTSEDDWFADEARSGGMIVDLMIHDLDYARWLGGPVRRVYARSLRSVHPNVHQTFAGDYALVTLRFASGAMALVEGGWAYPPGVFRTGFDLAGRRGVIEWDSERSEPLRRDLWAAEGEAERVGLPRTLLAEDPYTTEIRHVHQALLTGEPFAVSADEALEALRLALAARASAAQGRPLELEAS